MSDKRLRPPPQLNRSSGRDLRSFALECHSKFNKKKPVIEYVVTECSTSEMEAEAFSIAYEIFKKLTGKNHISIRKSSKNTTPAEGEETPMSQDVEGGEETQTADDVQFYDNDEVMEKYYSNGYYLSLKQATVIRSTVTDTCEDMTTNDDNMQSSDAVDVARMREILQKKMSLQNMPLAMEELSKKKQKTPDHDFPFQYQISACKSQGMRSYNEDFYVVLENFRALFGRDKGQPEQEKEEQMEEKAESLMFLGVYDGHAGAQAAMYCATHLHYNIYRNKKFESDIHSALVEGFIETDFKFNKLAEEKGYDGGTTAVAVVIRGSTMYVANCGDSRAYICTKQPDDTHKLVSLTKDHSPIDTEKERIENLGGTVVWYGSWRVNGKLAVSRSIGDRELKHLVIADPDVVEHKISPEDEFLILGSDGIWDVLDDDQVIECVWTAVQERGKEFVSEAIIERAIELKSKDNLSAVVTFFEHGTDK